MYQMLLENSSLGNLSLSSCRREGYSDQIQNHNGKKNKQKSKSVSNKNKIQAKVWPDLDINTY